MDESPINNHNTNNKTSREPTDHHQNRGWGIKQMSVILWWTIAKRTRNSSSRSSSSVLITSTSGSSSKVDSSNSSSVSNEEWWSSSYARELRTSGGVWPALGPTGEREKDAIDRRRTRISRIYPRWTPGMIHTSWPAVCIATPLGRTDRSSKKREIGDNRLRVITVIH